MLTLILCSVYSLICMRVSVCLFNVHFIPYTWLGLGVWFLASHSNPKFIFSQDPASKPSKEWMNDGLREGNMENVWRNSGWWCGVVFTYRHMNERIIAQASDSNRLIYHLRRMCFSHEFVVHHLQPDVTCVLMLCGRFWMGWKTEKKNSSHCRVCILYQHVVSLPCHQPINQYFYQAPH